jgi:hypothetical protein
MLPALPLLHFSAVRASASSSLVLFKMVWSTPPVALEGTDFLLLVPSPRTERVLFFVDPEHQGGRGEGAALQGGVDTTNGGYVWRWFAFSFS